MTIHIYINISPYTGDTQSVIEGIISEKTEEICFNFNIRGYKKRCDIRKLLENTIEKSSVKEWIKPSEDECTIDCDLAKNYIIDLKKINWFKRIVRIKPEIDTDTKKYQIYISKKDVSKMENKIFLSHKSKNKPHVREFNSTLKLIGYDTLIDEDFISAGSSLDRTLLKGMKDSCAAVFFITPEFTDDSYLEAEIDYAIRQKREKGDGFQIITLSITDGSGVKGEVPELLKQYVWKEPKNDLEALREIIKSIPLIIKKPTKP